MEHNKINQQELTIEHLGCVNHFKLVVAWLRVAPSLLRVYSTAACASPSSPLPHQPLQGSDLPTSFLQPPASLPSFPTTMPQFSQSFGALPPQVSKIHPSHIKTSLQMLLLHSVAALMPCFSTPSSNFSPLQIVLAEHPLCPVVFSSVALF